MIGTLARLSGLSRPAVLKPRGLTRLERWENGKLVSSRAVEGRYVGRHRVMDADNMAFQFRMGAGSPGSVNRFHPASIEPSPVSGTTPPGIGLAAVIDAASKLLRLVQAGDTSLVDIYGVLVRPWPFQGSPTSGFSGAQGFGTTNPVSAQFGVWDVLRSGYIIVPINGTPGKGDAVNVWVAASSGAHTQGGFEQNSTGGSTIPITGNDKTTFNGPPDAFGNGEICFNI